MTDIEPKGTKANPYCTHCGRQTEYMGIRKVETKSGYIYDWQTGKPWEEQWWRCPETKKWYASPYHDTFSKRV